jgi:uncharacterized protein (DUF58 family)
VTLSRGTNPPFRFRLRRPDRPERAAPLPAPYDGTTRQRDLPAQLLKRIELKVLRRLDGFLFGDYAGLFYGPSLDLAEVREYQPGDEVRRIDWNVTARSGTMHVRQYREEREVICWLVVDLSASMAFGTRSRSKRELALEFAAVTASVLTRRGNKVGSMGFSERGASALPLGSGRGQPLALLRSLMRAGPEGAFGRERSPDGPSASLAEALAHAGRTLRRRALVFVVSDFITPESIGPSTKYGRNPEWDGPLRRLALRHDVIAVRVFDPAERELPDAGELRLRDPETGREMWVDTSDRRVRTEFARLAAERNSAVEHALRRARVDLLELSTERDIVPPLVRFTLTRRGRRG